MLGIMLVRARISKIDQNSVAHVSGDEPAKPGDGLGHVPVIDGDHLAQILGVEPYGERGRPDEIAEHDREVPPLGRGYRWRRRRAICQRGAAVRAELRVWGIAVAARGTCERQRRAALDAELATVRDLGLAARAVHATPYRLRL